MDYLKLSKEVSYALRHEPWEYKLELDKDGWVETSHLINVLKENSQWKKLTENDLLTMIMLSDKKRHEIVQGKIRALYGHSTPNKIKRTSSEPPEILYHGTTKKSMTSIRKQGLLPQARQYVHLSIDKNTAMQVGKRYDENPVLLLINSKKAWQNGVLFYYGNDKVWLANLIPCDYINEI